MKNTIKEALKQAYKNLGLSEKAFDGVASFLETTVKEETQIDDAVKSAETLLKAFQGEVDRERSGRANLQKELDELKAKQKQTPPTPKDEPQPKNDEPNPKDETAKKLAEMEAQLLAMKQEKARGSLMSNVEAMLTEKKVPKSYFAPLLEVRSFGEQDTAESIAKDIESKYEALEVEIAKERFGGVTIPDRSEPPVDSLDAFAKVISESNKEITK